MTYDPSVNNQNKKNQFGPKWEFGRRSRDIISDIAFLVVSSAKTTTMML
jgi:hypothetical protein